MRSKVNEPNVPTISSEDPVDYVHLSLQPLIEAAKFTHAKVAVVPVAMHTTSRSWLIGRRGYLYKILLISAAHLLMVRSVWRRRDNDLVLVREFVTPFLLLVWPLIWPLRRHTYFLSNHNLQAAVRGKLEHLALRLLLLAGLRLAVTEALDGLESMLAPAKVAGVLVLPSPLDRVVEKKPEALGEYTVGVVGTMRSEKGGEQVLDALWRLRMEGRLSMHLLLGCPEEDVRARWKSREYEVVDTTRMENYEDALDRCDVVVLNYQRERYLFRSSGVISDALRHRTLVVCPNYPLLRHQLVSPARVGCVFDSIEQLEGAISEALALKPQMDDALEQHLRMRNTAAIARVFDEFVSSQGLSRNHRAGTNTSIGSR